MFSIPLFHYTIDNWPEARKKLINVMDTQKFENAYDVSNVSTSYGVQFKDADLELKQILQPTVDEFIKESEIQNPMIADMWFQKYKEQQFHAPHNHGPYGWSSVLYIKYDPAVHKATRFIAPFPDVQGRTINYSPQDVVKEGSWIWFPAFINHYTTPNKTDEERIIMSCNMVDVVSYLTWEDEEAKDKRPQA